MQACLENDSLPLLESACTPRLDSTSLPLFQSATLPLGDSAPPPSVDAAPAWTIRIARPAAADRNELAKELCGVPKAALRQVFGKLMGTRLWQLNRLAPKVAAVAPPARLSANAQPAKSSNGSSAGKLSSSTPSAKQFAEPQQIPDSEIRSGMLRYLCTEAATMLHERNRLANSISLTAQYSDGRSETVRRLLLQSANDADALEAAARLAIRAMRSDAFVSLKLDLTATPPCAEPHAVEPAPANAPLTCVA
ncbi:MAG TPA: hypothetical protein VGJ06_19690 [Candidatus Acidoferrum sp.]|jgi:hypothetical protein